MSRLIEVTLRNGQRSVLEVRLSLDAGPLERALLGLEFMLACLPCRPRALGPGPAGGEQ